MHTLMSAEGRQLEQDIDRLGRTLPLMARPSGMRQRAKTAFIKQLHAYKCERLEAVQEALEQSRARRLADWNRVRRI